MARARPAHWPAVRISRGRSLGPTTTNATTRMTRSSLQAISNILFSHRHGRSRRGRTRARGSGSAVLDLFGLLGFGRLLFIGKGLRILRVFQAFFEVAYPVREIAHQPGDLAAAAEQQRHHHDQDQPVPNAKTAHRSTPTLETS